MNDSIVSYKSPWSYCWAFVALVVWSVVSLVLYFLLTDPTARGIVVVCIAMALVVVVRAFLASVTIAPDRLVVHGLIRTRTFDWSEIELVDAGSLRLSGTGSAAYCLRYKCEGDTAWIKPTLHGATTRGRTTIGHLLTTIERASTGHAVKVTRSDPWNAGTDFPA